MKEFPMQASLEIPYFYTETERADLVFTTTQYLRINYWDGKIYHNTVVIETDKHHDINKLRENVKMKVINGVEDLAFKKVLARRLMKRHWLIRKVGLWVINKILGR